MSVRIMSLGRFVNTHSTLRGFRTGFCGVAGSVLLWALTGGVAPVAGQAPDAGTVEAELVEPVEDTPADAEPLDGDTGAEGPAVEDGAEPANADADATSGAGAGAGAGAGEDEAGARLAVTVTGVQGLVQARNSSEDDWRAVRAGMRVPVGAEFRTGPRSAVQFRLGEDHEVTLDRLGTVKVLEALERDGRVVTDVGMPYGRTQYRVEGSGVEHDSTIRSPSSTLVVRGTDVVVLNQGFQRRVRFLERTEAQRTDSQGRTVAASEGELEEDDPTAAKTAEQETIFSSLGDATTEEEMKLQSLFGGNNLFGAVGGSRGGGAAGLPRRGALAGVPQSVINQIAGGGVRPPPPSESIGDVNTNLAVFPLRIFDDAIEDGDIVQVRLNNNVLDPSLFLTNAGTVFNLTLNPGNNVFTAEFEDAPDSIITGSVEAPNESGDFFDFSMSATPGEKRSLLINRGSGR